MEMRYMTHYSGNLGREMEFKVYGHSGKSVIFIPCQGGRFFDFENFGMADVFAPWIQEGQLTVYAVDVIDGETYANQGGDPRRRLEQHERWIRYFIHEFVPMVHHLDWERNGWVHSPILFGCSMGAMHAGNLFFRFPYMFDGVLALSGLYDSELFFGDYGDDLLYDNTPNRYLANMPAGHPYITMYNERQAIFCVGQGAWEDALKASTGRLSQILQEKGIRATVDFWGLDVSHDWEWWYKQVQYYMPRFL